MTFTPEQSSAINASGADILVSAAAGSGKTAVLTERIMRHIREGTSLDRLLVVTFTEAAAAEMRERIGAKLAEQFEREPANAHIARQLAILPRAEVSTIHAFCRKLLKEHFQEAGLDPSFKVGDEAETRLLQSQVMDELLMEEYERGDNAEILDLSDAFGGRTGDERLDAAVRALFSFLESDPFPEKAAQRYMEMYENGISKAESGGLSPWIEVALDELQEGLDGALDGIRSARKICLEPDGPEKYLTALQADEDLIRSLIASFKISSEELSFEAVYEAFSVITWTRIHTYRKTDGVDEALKERAKAIRDRDVKERVNKLAKSVFFAPPEKMRADMLALSGRVRALLKLTLKFAERYAEEKRSRNLLDFNDLEHFAIKVLTAKGLSADGETGDSKESVSFKYKEVLIDEYQDSNSVQELILSAVAGSGHRFMVGDVKQGIYRFRRANPQLFVEKYNEYAPVNSKKIPSIIPSDASAKHPSSRTSGFRIDLSKNFRSRAHVLDAINAVFTRLLSPEVGEIAYDERAALYPGADYPPLPAGVKPETWVEIASSDEPETSGEGEEAEVSKLEREAVVIASCVKELLQTRDCKLGDMVVLTRSISSVARPLTEALKRLGVDAAADLTTGFYDTPEIKLALAFLRVTDNPRQDIDLIAVLHSAVYGVTPDELLAIREADKDGDYYDALLAAREADKDGCYNALSAVRETDNDGGCYNAPLKSAIEKVPRFLRDLEKWRQCAAYMPISRLIGIIFDDTGLPAHVGAMPGGSIRRANLRLLLERAIQYEETSFTGLFHFINYLRRLYASGGADSVSSARDSAEGGGKLRIMTIHKSKGLEFPIVFVSQLGKQFNREDERGSLITHPRLGIGSQYLNLETRVRSNTVGRYAVSRLTRRETMSEELRVLYVAMTRAKEMLILTGCASGLEKKTERWNAVAERKENLLPVYYRREAQTYLDWIMPCVMKENGLFRVRIHEEMPEIMSASAGNIALVDSSVSVDNIALQESSAPTDGLEQADLQKWGAALGRCGNFYKQSAVQFIAQPSKLSISEVKRIFNDLTPDSAQLFADAPAFEPPKFLQEKKSVSSSRMGTALHTVAEHLDWHTHRSAEAIGSLIESLTESNLLSAEDAAAINVGQIETLANSDIAERIRRSPSVRREVPFVMRYDFYGSGEEVLTHGIIDCFFEEDGEAVLVDFKSGRVNGDPGEWAKQFTVQMGIYKKAVEASAAVKVKEVWIYSLALGRGILLTSYTRSPLAKPAYWNAR